MSFENGPTDAVIALLLHSLHAARSVQKKSMFFHPGDVFHDSGDIGLGEDVDEYVIHALSRRKCSGSGSKTPSFPSAVRAVKKRPLRNQKRRYGPPRHGKMPQKTGR